MQRQQLKKSMHFDVAPLSDREEYPYALEMTENILRKIACREGSLPTYCPLVKLSSYQKDKSSFSVSFLSSYHGNAGKFFYEMITRFLIPSHPLPVLFFFLSPFRVLKTGEALIVGELEIELADHVDMKGVIERFEILKVELELGLKNAYYGSKILEMKTLSLGEKRAFIQERVVQMIRRFPNRFDYDIFSLMQRFFIGVNDQYLRIREVRQVTHNLSCLYLLANKLKLAVEKTPNQRHLFIKLTKRVLHLPFCQKNVYGVLVGLNFLRENELFTEKHLEKAIQSIVPSAKRVEGSGFSAPNVLYLEVEKEEEFSFEEIKCLKKELTSHIKGRIEQLHHPVFMPRNEEEVMRHIITLGRELKFLRDLPQVIISFEKQTDQHLVFTLIVARILSPQTFTSFELVSKLKHSLNPQIDRVKVIGKIRKKYLKEGVVCKVELPVTRFLREDHSVDLYLARHKILSELEGVLGEVRDFNGGIISKQNEVFSQLKEEIGKDFLQHRLLLENFFHSLFPVERRSCIDPKHLQVFFHMLLKILEKPPSNNVEVNELKNACLILIEYKDPAVKEFICSLDVLPLKLITLQLTFDERDFLGYLYTGEKRKMFIQKMVEQVIVE